MQCRPYIEDSRYNSKCKFSSFVLCHMLAKHNIVSCRCLVSFAPRDLDTNAYFLTGMIMGACLEADHRIRQYEAKVRMQKRMVRDRAVWERYEQEFDEHPPPSKTR